MQKLKLLNESSITFLQILPKTPNHTSCTLSSSSAFLLHLHPEHYSLVLTAAKTI